MGEKSHKTTTHIPPDKSAVKRKSQPDAVPPADLESVNDSQYEGELVFYLAGRIVQRLSWLLQQRFLLASPTIIKPSSPCVVHDAASGWKAFLRPVSFDDFAEKLFWWDAEFAPSNRSRYVRQIQKAFDGLEKTKAQDAADMRFRAVAMWDRLLLLLRVRALDSKIEPALSEYWNSIEAPEEELWDDLRYPMNLCESAAEPPSVEDYAEAFVQRHVRPFTRNVEDLIKTGRTTLQSTLFLLGRRFEEAWCREDVCRHLHGDSNESRKDALLPDGPTEPDYEPLKTSYTRAELLEQVARQRLGGEVIHLGTLSDPPEFPSEDPRTYVTLAYRPRLPSELFPAMGWSGQLRAAVRQMTNENESVKISIPSAQELRRLDRSSFVALLDGIEASIIAWQKSRIPSVDEFQEEVAIPHKALKLKFDPISRIVRREGFPDIRISSGTSVDYLQKLLEKQARGADYEELDKSCNVTKRRERNRIQAAMGSLRKALAPILVFPKCVDSLWRLVEVKSTNIPA